MAIFFNREIPPMKNTGIMTYMHANFHVELKSKSRNILQLIIFFNIPMPFDRLSFCLRPLTIEDSWRVLQDRLGGGYTELTRRRPLSTDRSAAGRIAFRLD